MLSVGSLFSGIGGFDYGLERAGMRVVWQCEADDFCRRVLAAHWPDVPCYPDVRQVQGLRVGSVRSGSEVLAAPVDVLCGGFPCQDISSAGRKVGIGGERSGLWAEFARLIGELRPRYVIVENVAALLARGIDVVLHDLAACGYDAEWDCLPASAFGAPHRRDRLWLVAYPNTESEPGQPVDVEAPGLMVPQLADADAQTRDGQGAASGQVHRSETVERSRRRSSSCGDVQDADSSSLDSWRIGGRAAQAGGPEWWAVEPPVGRVAHGVPDRLDQLAALGNALVPQIAEWLGTRILDYERRVTDAAA